MEWIYLDYVVMFLMDECVLEKMILYFFGNFGNLFSIYLFGREFRKWVDEVRVQIVVEIGVVEQEIIFISGGMEVDNLVIMGIVFVRKDLGRYIIMIKIEYYVVFYICEKFEEDGFEVMYLDVD